MTELERLLIEAFQVLEKRLTATELAQQFVLMHWRSLDSENAKVLSQALRNVSSSDKVETDEYCRKYLSHLARFLDGDLDAPVWGLKKPSSPEPDKPIPWLKGVIEGGKSTKA